MSGNLLMIHHIDIDSMSEEEMKSNLKFLLNENSQLKLVNGAITEKLKTFSDEVSKLTDANTKLLATALSDHLLVEQNNNLHQNLGELQKENLLLKSQNEMLNNKLIDYEKRIVELETRDEPITIREAIRILEAHICLEAVGGSKTKFKKGNYNFDAIAKTADPKVTSELKKVLIKRGLSSDHLTTISYLKDCGDFGAHVRRPGMTKLEWIAALTKDDISEASELDVDEEDQKLALMEIKIKTDLVNVLEGYNPSPSSGGIWEIRNPVEKPMKEPVLKLSTSAKSFGR
jgi:hypothetical protein